MHKQFKDLATRSGAMAMAAAMAFSPCMNVMATDLDSNNINHENLDTNSNTQLLDSTNQVTEHNLSDAISEFENYINDKEITSVEDHEYGNVELGEKVIITAEHYEKFVKEGLVRIKTLPNDSYNTTIGAASEITLSETEFIKNEETGNYELIIKDRYMDKDLNEQKIYSNNGWKLFARFTPIPEDGTNNTITVTGPFVPGSSVELGTVVTGGTHALERVIFYMEAVENQEDTHIIDYSIEPEWEFDLATRQVKATFKCFHGDCNVTKTFTSGVDAELNVLDGVHEGNCTTIGKHYYTATFSDGTHVYEKEFFVEERELDDHLFDVTADGGLKNDENNHYEVCLRDGCNVENTYKEREEHNLKWKYNDTYHWKECDTCEYEEDSSKYTEHSVTSWTESKPADYGVKGEEKGTCECGKDFTRETEELVDDIVPSIEIKVNDLTSKDFTGKIESKIYTNKDIVIKINATDAETEVKSIEYIVSNKVLSTEDLKTAEFKKIESGKDITIDKDSENYIYVRATDKEGNTRIAWLESGIIKDTVAPEITEIKDGDTYCENPILTVKEDRAIDKVKLNDKEVNLDSNNSYNVIETGELTIEVTDKAGNKTTIKFKNNGKHSEVIDKQVDATCVNTGLTEGSHCEVCDEVIKKQEEIPVGDHSFKTGQLDRKSTANLEGRIQYDCIHCDWYYYETIPVDGKTDEGEIDKGIYVYKDAPASQIISSKEELMDMDIFTNEELVNIEDEKVHGHVFFKVEELKEEELPEKKFEALELLAEKVGAEKDLYMFSMSLYKQIDKNEAVKINDPGNNIKVRLTIPSDIVKENREIFLFGYRNGEAFKIEGKYNTKTHDFTFEVSEDSIYAIGYKDNSKNTNTDDESNITEDTDDLDEVPDMGDISTIDPASYAMLISGIIGLVTSKKKKNN